MNRFTLPMASLIGGLFITSCSSSVDTSNFNSMTIKFIPADSQLWYNNKPVTALSWINNKGECVIWHMVEYGLQCIKHEIKECDSLLKTGKSFHEGRDSNEHCK